MKTFLYLVFFNTLLILVSCQKNEDINDLDSDGVTANKTGQLFAGEKLIVLDSIEVTADGALNFLSPTAYYRSVRKLLECSDKELDLWEQSIGFTSMRSEVNKLTDIVYDAENKTQTYEIIRQYPDLVEQGSRGEIKPVIEAVFYRNILSKAGYFYLNGDKYQVTKENVTITFNNTLTRSTPQTLCFSYCQEPVYTRASPGTNSKTGLNGCQTGGGKFVNGSHEEIIFETKYKVYKNELYPPAIMSISGRPFGPHYTLITYYLDYYVQIDAWQWKLDSWNNNWSYYRPAYELVIKNIKCKIKDIDKTSPNFIGASGDYHTSYTIQMGTIQGESIPYNPSETWKDQPTIPLEYINYTVANFEPGYSDLNVYYEKKI